MPASAVHVDARRLKTVILIGSFARGGCERQAYLLARHLRQHEAMDVEVWSLMHDGDYRAEFEAAQIPTRVLQFRAPDYRPEGVQLVRIPLSTLVWQDPIFPLRWLVRLRRIAMQLRHAKVDVLLPFTTWPNVIAGLVYRFAGVRLCVWGERHAGGERIAGLERLAARQYRRFVANSSAGVEFLAREMRLPRERITFVANGVEEPGEGAADWRAGLGLKRGQLLVVKVANLTSFKDHATLLRSWKRIQDSWQGPERPVLALAGYHGDRYDACRELVRAGGMDETVRFLGGVTDVAGLMRASDVAVFSSRKEGMPNGVLECMAAGKPVIATDLPGVRDALGPDAAASLCAPEDSDELAAKLLDVLRDSKARERRGAANLARIRNEFSVERMAARHLHVIQDCLSDGSQGGVRSSNLHAESAASRAGVAKRVDA
jgi:glycosyltransferase involved in cell wall biosynthesis